MYYRRRNDAFARCVAERYTDQEESMETEKLTPEEIAAYRITKARCAELIERNQGECPSYACPFYRMCQELPEAWDLGEHPKLTDQETKLLGILGAAGAEVVGKTAYGTPYWRYADDDVFFGRTLPLHVFPSVKPGQEIKLHDAACVEKEEAT